MSRRAPCVIGSIGLALVGCAGDPEPIVFENVRVEEVTAYRAVVRFETSRESTCEVRFGTSPDSMDLSATDPTMEEGTFLTEHEVPLEDLAPETMYHFQPVAIDPDDNQYLAEADVFATGEGLPVDAMTNVALMTGGTAITGVSSNWSGGGNDSVWGAQNAIDGAMTTEWSSDGDGDEAWLEVDLGATHEVSVIGFRSRKMTDGTSIVKSFTLVVDGGATTLGPFATPDPDSRYVLPLEERVPMRTIRLEAEETTGGNTGLKEFQLFVP